jgi:hypothetical protein
VSAREASVLISAPARFALEAAFIVLAGVVAAGLRLSPVAIVLVMGLAWVLVAVVERVAKSGRPTPASEPPAPREGAETDEPLAATPAPNPEPRRRIFSERHSAAPSDSSASNEWNLWELERRAREHVGSDAVPHEWAATFMSLREFAKSDGRLPSQFDSLVRESFPELTRVPT